MIRYIKSSAGDVVLHKFVAIPCDKIEGIDEDNYDETLHGYMYLWEYTYNKLTHATDDRMYPHSNVIDNLPSQLKRMDWAWGRVDWYRDSRRFFINDPDIFTKSQLTYIKRICNFL